MIVLGLSGLPAAQEELRRSAPNLLATDERICQGLDSAACLIVDGSIIAAAAQERFDGIKGTGALPRDAIDWCLRTADVGASDVDAIAHGFDYDRYARLFLSQRDYFTRVLSAHSVVDALEKSGWQDVARRFRPVEHHLAHASSAVFPSGFDNALCIVSDGMAEVDSLSIYEVRGQALRRIHRQPIADSLGLLYSICTRFLGFAFNSDEYKVMGLAAYGDPAPYRSFMRRLAEFNAQNGSVRIHWPRTVLSEPAAGYPHAMAWISNAVGFAPRQPGELLTQIQTDFAAALQERLTELLEMLTKYWLELTGHDHLCLAGGTFLNCKANEALCNLPNVRRVFIQPAAGDDGTALGAALFVSRSLGSQIKNQAAFNPYCGPSFTVDEVSRQLESLSSQGKITSKYLGMTDAYFDAAAQDIAADKIVGWFHGAMEYGPRALGNRSILALPCGNQIKERINGIVKFREAFRPFAPAVLDEDCSMLFSTRALAPTRYMLCTARATEIGRQVASGVVHADGSARVQIVDEEANATFYRLLRSVKAMTGWGCTVNTSFNVKGQPLIMDPRTAIDTFMTTGLDKLYIEGHIVWKNI